MAGSRRFTTIAIAGLALVVGTPLVGTAHAQNASVIGRWRTEGQHARRGYFAGSVEIKDSPTGLRYSRQTRFDIRRPAELETGSVTLDARGFTLTSDPSPGTGGLSTGIFTSSGTSGPFVRRATLVSVGNGRYEGSFVVQGGAPDDRGTERLSRTSLGQDSFELLVDGPEFFPRLRQAIPLAKQAICVETFSWKDDKIGNEVANLLIERARAGVKVRVIVDSAGSRKVGPVMDRLKAVGAEVVMPNPLSVGTFWNDVKDWGKSALSLIGFNVGGGEKRGLLNREHRKVVVIDGLVGFTGGMGFGNHYESDWHDVMCRVEGPIVHAITREFVDRWRSWGGKPITDLRPLFQDRAALGLQPAGDIALHTIVSVPGVRREGKDTYLREIRRAKKKVHIENPYFLDDDIIDALSDKARQGVPVLAIIPNDKAQDENLVRDAFSFIQNDVVRSGIELRKYRNRMVHAKVATIDGLWATVGSTNLDTLSLERLCELNVAAYDPRVARLLETRIFAKDVPDSDRVAVRELSFWKKLKGGALQFIRSFI